MKADKTKVDTIDNLRAIKSALSDTRLRGIVSRQRDLTIEGNVYGDLISEEKFEEFLVGAVENEYFRQKILEKISDTGKSVPDIAKEKNIEPYKVLEHIVQLRARGLVDFEEIEGLIPKFISIREES